MYRLGILTIFLFSCIVLSCSQPSRNAAQAISLFNKVSFVPPSGLRQLTKEEIARRFSAVQPPPQYVFAQDDDALAVKIYLQEVPDDARSSKNQGIR